MHEARDAESREKSVEAVCHTRGKHAPEVGTEDAQHAAADNVCAPDEQGDTGKNVDQRVHDRLSGSLSDARGSIPVAFRFQGDLDGLESIVNTSELFWMR